MTVAAERETPTVALEALEALMERGWEEAGEVPDAESRAAHQEAWLLRAAAIDPDRAATWLQAAAGEPGLRARVLVSLATRRVSEGEAHTTADWESALAALQTVPEVGLRLELFNELCEAAIHRASEDPERSLGFIRTLVPLLDELVGEEEELATSRALGLALLGESLAVLEDPEGAQLLERAAVLSEELPARDHVLAFVAQSQAARDPRRARELAATIFDPGARFETRLTLVQRLDAADPERPMVAEEARGDIQEFEEARRSEGYARLAAALGSDGMEQARPLYQEALDALRGNPPQLRALQMAGIAASAGARDPEWGARLFEEAVRVARSEPERVRRVVALIAVAYQRGHGEPEAAQALIDEALQEGLSLDATWEIAHALEILFDPRGRPELDLTGAQPLLEAALERVGDDELRLPGLLGLPEIARHMLQVNPRRARDLFERWLTNATADEEPEGMLHAALSLYTADREAGRRALAGVASELARRADTFALGQFCWTAGEAAREAASRIALALPPSRERTRALGAVAAAAWVYNPAEAEEYVALLPDAQERSVARLRIVDRLLGTDDLPRPAAESEVNICCSLIVPMEPEAGERLAAELAPLAAG